MSKAGITAQKLRHLDILLVKPWSVRVGPEQDVPIAADVDLFVPNPTSFIVQKLLIHSDRPPHKKAQDILYIHDTLELFGGSLGELRRLWVEEVRPAMPSKTARKGGGDRSGAVRRGDRHDSRGRADSAGPPARARERPACLRVWPGRDPPG